MSGRRILVVGSGAREHAICWRLAGEGGTERLIVAPGNPLMADVAHIRPEVSAADIPGIVALALHEQVALVVIGPEGPLAAGLADALSAAGVACFGPRAAAAMIEASKSFCRDVCVSAGVAMAEGESFVAVAPALAYARRLGAPLVVKADGLAAGKGVTVCESLDEAERAIADVLLASRFGDAGGRVVVERRLDGAEASLIAICDERTALLLPPARDHKRLLDGDGGPNTGGMGAYSPVADVSPARAREIGRSVHLPVLAELNRRGRPFRGALYAGLMLTTGGPCVLEFNVRLGDPEAQAILPRLAVPLGPLLAAAAHGRLAESARDVELDDACAVLPTTAAASVALTVAAAGYPDAPRRGDEVSGVAAARQTGALIFGAGVERDGEGRLLTAGGRVLTVVGQGDDIDEAAERAYAAAQMIDFDGRQMRHDIGRAATVALA